MIKQEARNEKVHTPLNIDQALDARDAIAKALYRYRRIAAKFIDSPLCYDQLNYNDNGFFFYSVRYSDG